MFDKNRFRAQVVLCGKTYEEVAKEMGIDASTLYRKVSADGNFTRSEINKLIVILHVDDPKAIFFADELTETQV